VISAGRGDNVHEVIQRDLAGSRVVLACDVVPENFGRPVVQVWPGRRIGEGRVGDAITHRERQTDALRGVRRLVVVLKAG
jgi:hypothetical protein